MRYLSAILLVLILAAVIPGMAFAQETEAPADTVEVETEPTDLERAQESLNTVTAELDSLLVLASRIKDSEDEQLKLLRVQGGRHIDTIDNIQPGLLNLLSKLDPDDPETEKVRKGTLDFLIAKFDIYEESLNWWSREIDELREQRSNTPPEELGDQETRIGKARERLDAIMPAMMDIIQDSETLGFEAEKVWQRFDRSINNRAENLVGRLQISVDARETLKNKIATGERAGSPESEIGADRTRLQYAEARVQGVAKSLGTTVDMLGERGFETAPYRQFIIRTTGEITERVLDPRVMIGLAREFMEDLGEWLEEKGPTILVKLLIIIASVIFFRLTFRLVWWLMRLVRIVNLTRLMVQLGNSLLGPIATIFGLFFGFWLVGADPTTLLAGAGVAGVVIGFALQDSLANLAAGFFILATRPFDVDDTIRTGTVVGTVKAMWIANTTVVTFDGRRLLIPNRMIWADIIENRSVEPLRRVDITVRVGYDEDIDRAIEILLDLVRSENRILDHPEPVAFVSSWADSWVEIAVRPWGRNEDWWPLLKDLPRLVALRFAEEGIEIPYPRMEMGGVTSPETPRPESSD